MKKFYPILRIYFHLLLTSVYTNAILKICESIFCWKIIDINKIIETSTLKNKNRACHILGSGHSLKESIKTIDEEKDSVIGFNFSGLAYEKADIYFIEIAASRENKAAQNISKSQHLLWQYLQRNSPQTKFIFKNTWERKNSLRTINLLYGKNVTYLKDAVGKASDEASLKALIDIILSDFLFFKNQAQTISTTITAIALAYKAGFKEIIIHGVDFSGPHFYETSSYENATLREIQERICSKSTTPINHPHRTNTATITHQQALVCLRNQLSKNGVILRAALPQSNLGIALKND